VSVHILGVAVGDFAQFLLGGGVDGIEIFARMGRGEFAVDEQFVARVDFHRNGFRRGRVIPPVAKFQPAVPDGGDRFDGMGRRHGFQYRHGAARFEL
jgi:hypothetical protein